jgi:5'-nucleotidase
VTFHFRGVSTARLLAALLLLLSVLLALLVSPNPVGGAAGVLGRTPAPEEPTSPTVRLKVLAINDLHGHLSRTEEISGRPVGGVAYLATYLKQRSAAAPHSLIVSAGDLFGASDPESALLDEVPTVDAATAMGIHINAPGNHELDRGVDRFLEVTASACRFGGCQESGAIRQVSSNVWSTSTGAPLLDPYSLERIDGVPVAFIGAVHGSVPLLNRRGTINDVWFLDPAQAINTTVGELIKHGVHAFVLVIHEGGYLDADGRLVGPITSILDRLRPEVQVVISAHTHHGYAVRRDGRLVTQAFADAQAFADIDLTLDRASGTIANAEAEIVRVYSDAVPADPTVERIVAQAAAATAARTTPLVGVAAAELTKLHPSRAGETELGNLVADAQRAAVGADIAVTNLFNIRASIDPGEVTWRDLFIVHPYAQRLVALSLTGSQLYTLFNQQWTIEEGNEMFRPLQVSGLRVSWDGRRPLGDRVVSLRLADGSRIDLDATYRVVVNDFLARGGDGCAVLAAAGPREMGPIEADALAAYIPQLPQPFTAGIEGRLTRLD